MRFISQKDRDRIAVADAVAVAQIDKNNPAMITAAMNADFRWTAPS
mgnify:CR=1 FL=1